MASKQLENLVATRQLDVEPGTDEEVQNLLGSGSRRLLDAENTTLSLESRFDLAYNAAHALALAALRHHGFRSSNRYVVFQVLPHTLGIPNEQWRVLDSAHRKRNRAEYDGDFDVDEALVAAVIRVARALEAAVTALPPLG